MERVYHITNLIICFYYVRENIIDNTCQWQPADVLTWIYWSGIVFAKIIFIADHTNILNAWHILIKAECNTVFIFTSDYSSVENDIWYKKTSVAILRMAVIFSYKCLIIKQIFISEFLSAR